MSAAAQEGDRAHDDADLAVSRVVGGWPATVVALVAWSAFVALAVVQGEGIRASAKVRAAPLMGRLESSGLAGVPVALAVGLVLAWVLPPLCARLGWRRLLLLVAVASVGWGIGVAAIRGTSGPEGGIVRGVTSEHDYAAVLPFYEHVGFDRFTSTYTDPDVLAGYPIHVEGHPIGAPLVFVAADGIGIDTPDRLAVALLLLGATIGPAVLVAAREVAGEAFARRAAPFLVLAPSAIWLITSGDALFSAAGAWGIALLVLATGAHRSTRARAVLAVAGGATFAFGLHLSYGLAPLGLVPAVVVVARRRWSVVPFAALGAAAVTAGYLAIGFWWFDGLAATHDRYLAGAASLRPGRYFALLGNPAALALAVGPAVAVAVARVRGWRAWLLPGAALAAVAAADLSGLSKGEVERIWLPFQPWLLLLTGGLAATTLLASGSADAAEGPPATVDVDGDAASGPGDPARSGGPPALAATPASAPWRPTPVTLLLAAQVAVTVAIEHLVRTPW